ncbi:hypothetical protein GCM10009795_060880 [Nocardioides hankookensis]|uniref:Collagen binding domain-containing protein n=1 Tax=Nocardioides hankookensis TaxID=443157 RepID=A0ABW1LQ01_9ACTN
MSRDRRLRGSIILLACLSAGLLGLSPASGPALAASEPTGRITGTVTGPGGVPLEGATVSAYPVHCPNGCAGYTDSTDADGSYEVDLPAGAYILLIQQGFGYLAEYYDNQLEQEDATQVVVAAGGTVTGRNAQLEHGGHLTGTVTGRGGRPVKGITVTAYRKARGSWQYVGQESTARNGSYHVDDLLSGTYRLRFTDDAEPGYLPEYSDSVVLDEDATVTALDARLAWPRTLRSVKAPKVTGKPQAGATLTLVPGTWSPRKVKVEVLGWYADDLYHWLNGQHARKIRLVGRTLAQARGHVLLVRFQVSAPGYITVDRTIGVGKVTG